MRLSVRPFLSCVRVLLYTCVCMCRRVSERDSGRAAYEAGCAFTCSSLALKKIDRPLEYEYGTPWYFLPKIGLLFRCPTSWSGREDLAIFVSICLRQFIEFRAKHSCRASLQYNQTIQRGPFFFRIRSFREKSGHFLGQKVRKQ